MPREEQQHPSAPTSVSAEKDDAGRGGSRPRFRITRPAPQMTNGHDDPGRGSGSQGGVALEAGAAPGAGRGDTGDMEDLLRAGPSVVYRVDTSGSGSRSGSGSGSGTLPDRGALGGGVVTGNGRGGEVEWTTLRRATRSTREGVGQVLVSRASLHAPPTAAAGPVTASRLHSDTEGASECDMVKLEPITPRKVATASGSGSGSGFAGLIKPEHDESPLALTPRRSTRRSRATTPPSQTQPSGPSVAHAVTPSNTPKRRRLTSATVKIEPPSTPVRELPGTNATLPGRDTGASATTSMPATPRSAKKVMPLPQLLKPHPEPARWREQYALIERMRKGIVAPVDDMGCERPNHNTTPHTRRFHILISLMLSSQTKDAVTSAAVTSLHTTLPGGLTATSLAAADDAIVSACIAKVGFWRRKTIYIKDAARYILEREPGVGDDGTVEEKGDVPKSLEGLCGIKGVGPKMAYLALQCAWEINAGIGVDVHVHRITNRLRWHRPQTQTPEQTRVNLESWLPKELFRSVNPMLVGFGQVVCLPVGPRCDVCLLSAARLCPSRVANVRAEGRKEVVYTFEALEVGLEGGVEGLDGVAQEGLGRLETRVKLEAMEDVDVDVVQVKYEEDASGTV